MLSEPQFDESETVAAMGGPGVVYLRYRLVPTNDATEFRAPSIDVETDNFTVHVGPEGEGVGGPFAAISARPADDGKGDENGLIVRPEVEAVLTFKTHHPSERSAHEAARPFLEAWELDEALREPGRPPRFHFEFVGSLIVDRAPPPGKEAMYAVSGEGSFYVRPRDQMVLVEEFPSPPSRFSADEHVSTLWRRWNRYLSGEDTLAAAAYACLTYVEKEFARGERDAAAKLAISRNVLSAIRQLASTVGDDTTARKFNRQPRRAHTPTEVTFLEAAVTALIRRLGELASGGSAAALPQLGMNDLPKL